MRRLSGRGTRTAFQVLAILLLVAAWFVSTRDADTGTVILLAMSGAVAALLGSAVHPSQPPAEVDALRTEIARLNAQSEASSRRADELIAQLRDPETLHRLELAGREIGQTRSTLDDVSTRLPDADEVSALAEATSDAVMAVTELREHTSAQRRAIERRIDAVFDQHQALQALYQLLDPPHPIPSMRGWAASPDVARFLVDEILTNGRRTIVELGSGTSTVLNGLALQRVGAGRVVAIEHDATFGAETAKNLERFGVTDHAEVVHAPLVDHVFEDGSEHRWYDVRHLPGDLDGIDLLFVDGPPGTTGPEARYPAVPAFRRHLAPGCLIVLDDADRPEERRVADRWAEELGVELRMLRHEKGTAILRLDDGG